MTFAQLADARECLGGLCGRLATERTEPGCWQDMVQLFGDPAATAVANGEIPLYLSYIGRLTICMIEAAANLVLKELLAMLTDRAAMLDGRSVLLPGRAERGLANHRLVIDAINCDDADKAKRQKRRSLCKARDVLLRYEMQFTRKETSADVPSHPANWHTDHSARGCIASQQRPASSAADAMQPGQSWREMSAAAQRDVRRPHAQGRDRRYTMSEHIHWVGHPGQPNEMVPAGWIRRIVDARFGMK